MSSIFGYKTEKTDRNEDLFSDTSIDEVSDYQEDDGYNDYDENVIVFSSHPSFSQSAMSGDEVSVDREATDQFLKGKGAIRKMMFSSSKSVKKKKVLDDPVILKRSKPNDFDRKNFVWNDKYQSLMDCLNESFQISPAKDLLTFYDELLKLSKDFLCVATMYGRIIISEKYLDDNDKTIKPANLGGIAGGGKYVKQGILYKFVVDNHGLYGGDEFAMKSANHELKGLMGYYNSGVSMLHLPLMAIIDYKGYRLIAITLIPIGDDTLLYGSADAGKKLHYDKEIDSMMQFAAEKMGIKGHGVKGDWDSIYTIHGPADIEVHRGFDNRLYLLDFARVFPPEAPNTKITQKSIISKSYSDTETGKTPCLYNLLRPEFVKKYSEEFNPLSSDAFMKFGSHDSKIHNNEVKEATTHLMKVVIPSFADFLDNTGNISYYTYCNLFKNGYNYTSLENIQLRRKMKNNAVKKIKNTLIEELHRYGINIRHLGQVRELCKSSEIRQILLIEMIARIIKNKMRKKWRAQMKKSPTPSEEPLKVVAVRYLNKVFGNSEQSKLYWQFKIKEILNSRFSGSLDIEEYSISTVLNTPDLLKSLFKRIISLVGIVLAPPLAKKTKQLQWFQQLAPLDMIDVISVKELYKTVNIVPFVEGLLLYYGSRERLPNESSWMLTNAIEKFEEALGQSPGGLWELFYLSKSLYELALIEKVSKAIRNLELSKDRLLYILELHPDVPVVVLTLGKVLYKIGMHLSNVNALKKALKYLRRYTHLSINDQEGAQWCSKISYSLTKLYRMKRDKENQIKYKKLCIGYSEKAVQLNSTDSQSWYNIGKLLSGENLDELTFSTCVDAYFNAYSLDTQNHRILYAWSKLLYSRAQEVCSVTLLFESFNKLQRAITLCLSVPKVIFGCARVSEFFLESVEMDESSRFKIVDTVKILDSHLTELEPLFVKDYSVPKIDNSQFVVEKEIPSKSYENIQIVKFETHQAVVVSLKEHSSKEEQYLFLNNIRLTRIVDHPNCIHLYGVVDDYTTAAFEFCELFDVRSSLNKEEIQPWDLILDIALQTAEAVAYLHSNNIIHNDLTARNLLFTADKTVKVRGFGLSTLTTESLKIPIQFVPNYTAPERLEFGTSTPATDIYSFGMLFYELGHNCRKIAFEGEGIFSTAEKIIQGEPLDIPLEWPLAYRHLIHCCIGYYPKTRISIYQLREILKKLQENGIDNTDYDFLVKSSIKYQNKKHYEKSFSDDKDEDSF